MSEFIANNLEFIGLIVLFIFIALVSLPFIFIALKGELLFAGLYSKRALIFSLSNAVLVTIILVIGSVFIGSVIADESAGAGMMMLIKISIGCGLIFGTLFPYFMIYLINSKK